MQTRALGTSGLEVPVVGLGTWNMELDGRAEAIAALRRGFEAGATHVDTAEMYGSGAVEELVGEALEGRREEAFLVSKVLPSNASRRGAVRACERSLARLRTDRLDLYLLHWPGPHPLGDTFEAFEELRERGLIGAWGVSNFDADELEEAVGVAGPGRVACNQVLYHVAERAIEHRVIPRCEALGVGVVAYSPFGSGEFPAPGSAGRRALEEVAARLGATPRQVALAFLTRRGSVAAIPKAGRADHAEENAGAGALRLSDEDVRAIDAALPLGPPPAYLPVI